MTEEYYIQKFTDLVAWLESDESRSEICAQQALDADDRTAAEKHLAAMNTAKRARMWIRNRVLLPVNQGG